jgi:hypothetical protein
MLPSPFTVTDTESDSDKFLVALGAFGELGAPSDLIGQLFDWFYKQRGSTK